MMRTRWGLAASSSFTLKLPLASVWVRPDSCIPWPKLRSTTSSPAAGFFVVPFVTAPVKVCAEAEAIRNVPSRICSKTLDGPDFSQSARETRHPVSCLPSLKLGLLFGDGVTQWPRLLRGARSRPEPRLLLLRERSSWSGSQNLETCRL